MCDKVPLQPNRKSAKSGLWTVFTFRYLPVLTSHTHMVDNSELNSCNEGFRALGVGLDPQPYDGSSKPKPGHVTWPVARRYYSIYDDDHGLVGFAKSIHPDEAQDAALRPENVVSKMQLLASQLRRISLYQVR